MGTKGISSCCGSLLQDVEVGAVNQYEAVVAYLLGAEPALEDDLGSGDNRG